jgi:hypothetical protein
MKKFVTLLSLALVLSLLAFGCSKKEQTQLEVDEPSEEEEIVYEELSLKELQVLALENDGEAAYYLGRVYDYGLMDEGQNFQEALKWYEVSAENNYGMGFIGEGYIYLNGCGVEQDFAKATECFQNAIKAKCMEGYVGVARCILEQEATDDRRMYSLCVGIYAFMKIGTQSAEADPCRRCDQYHVHRSDECFQLRYRL